MSLPIDLMQVSKSRKLPILIDPNEMEALFSALGNFELFDVSRPTSKDMGKIATEDFLTHYAQYVQGIQTGNLIDEIPLHPYFSAILSVTRDVLYPLPLEKGRHLIKAMRPVIQLQRHHFIFSNTFHSGVMGKGSVTWGIQFSYPQLFLDPQTNQIGKVENSPTFPNTQLFQILVKWVRNYTRATPFVFEEKRMNQPMRLGKGCFDWINNHPTLKARNLYVANQTHSHVSH